MQTPTFIDEVRIMVRGGDGGAGCVSFRREKFVPRGGPDGGDGGDGGDVFLVGKTGLSSLFHFRRKRHFKAERGLHGSGANRTGKSGASLLIEVPLGTIVKDESGEIVCEILEPGKPVLVAKGARGGRGNAAFKSPTNRAPRQFDAGRYGEERWLFLELKLLADVAIIGFPNSGKSTLISKISSAKPKIADYAFTTLVPNLGVVEAPGHSCFVVADVPGLIEGASEGKGMGIQFLRHVERSRILLHLLDGAALDPEKPESVYFAVRNELEAYSPELATKRELIAFNKADLGVDPKLMETLKSRIAADIHCISAATGQGVDELVLLLWSALQEDAQKEDWTSGG